MTKHARFHLKTPIPAPDAERLVRAGFIPVVRWVTRKRPYEHLTTTQAKKKLETN